MAVGTTARFEQEPPAPVALRRRHVVKAISWRIIGTFDTLILSLLLLTFLGPYLGIEPGRANHVETASYIAGTEVVTKILLYYFHERVWARLRWGRNTKNRKLTSAARRSGAKAFTWRALASFDTAVLAFIFTGNLAMAASIGGGEILTKLLLYFAHERIWARIGFGLPPGGPAE